MSVIPPNEVTQEDLNEWARLQKLLSATKASEMLLRTKIYKGLFKDPVEGTNSVDLAEGWVLKGKRNIDRSIDKGALTTLTEELRQQGIPVDMLIEYKPSLKLAEYRTLTAEQAVLFDQVLVIKDGAPALEIVLPKRRKA